MAWLYFIIDNLLFARSIRRMCDETRVSYSTLLCIAAINSVSLILGFRANSLFFLQDLTILHIKIENFRTDKFRKSNFGQKTFGRFFGNFGK